jgi:hypothetical protein
LREVNARGFVLSSTVSGLAPQATLDASETRAEAQPSERGGP